MLRIKRHLQDGKARDDSKAGAKLCRNDKIRFMIIRIMLIKPGAMTPSHDGKERSPTEVMSHPVVHL